MRTGPPALPTTCLSPTPGVGQGPSPSPHPTVLPGTSSTSLQGLLIPTIPLLIVQGENKTHSVYWSSIIAVTNVYTLGGLKHHQVITKQLHCLAV